MHHPQLLIHLSRTFCLGNETHMPLCEQVSIFSSSSLFNICNGQLWGIIFNKIGQPKTDYMYGISSSNAIIWVLEAKPKGTGVLIKVKELRCENVFTSERKGKSNFCNFMTRRTSSRMVKTIYWFGDHYVKKEEPKAFWQVKGRVGVILLHHFITIQY